MNSYLAVDYSGKIHKKIVRKIIGRLAERFSECAGSELEYIGMGSLFYMDFTEFYSRGFIGKMKSIEFMLDFDDNFDERKYKRFLMNRPYEAIELLPMSVREAVDTLPFDEDSLVWFDYDTTLTHENIEESADVIRKAKKSLMLVSTTGTQVSYMYKSDRRSLDMEVVRDSLGTIVGPDNDTFFEELTWDSFYESLHDIVTPYYERVVSEKNASEKRRFKLFEVGSIKYKNPSFMQADIRLLVDLDEIPEEKIKETVLSSDDAGFHLLDMSILTEKEKSIFQERKGEAPEVLADEIYIEPEYISKYYRYWDDVF